ILCIVLSCFFFQAEDGIRDRNVTGVQTCALPICYFVEPTVFTNVDESMSIAKEEIFGPVIVAMPYDDLDEIIERANNSNFGLARSEERRVGKECSARGWMDTYRVAEMTKHVTVTV